MLTSAQLQRWEAELQLPAMGSSSSGAHKKALSEDESNILISTEQQEEYPISSLIAGHKKKWANTAELSCLYLLGLFPYPVDQSLLLSTLSTLNIPAAKSVKNTITDESYSGVKNRLFRFSAFSALQKSSDKAPSNSEGSGSFHRLVSHLLSDRKPDADKLLGALHSLENASLISIDGDRINVFRPVRTYFADILKAYFFDDWRLQQQQLVYYYDDLAASAANNEQQFWFNCKKLLHSVATTYKQQALDDVYRPHISPELAKKDIGSAGYHLRLYLLTGFFQQPWTKTDFCLNAEAKGYVQAEAGQALYQLGEQKQALVLLDNARQVMVEAKSWTAASELAHLLGQHASNQQDVPESIRCFGQSIDYAEQGQNTNVVLRRMRSLFQLYKKNGNIEEAGVVADKAKALLAKMPKQNAKPTLTTA